MNIKGLFQVIQERKQTPTKNSYVASLFEQGEDRIIQKVGEEAVETVIAAKNPDKSRLVSEIADLWFHSLVLLVEKNVSFDDVLTELKKRSR